MAGGIGPVKSMGADPRITVCPPNNGVRKFTDIAHEDWRLRTPALAAVGPNQLPSHAMLMNPLGPT